MIQFTVYKIATGEIVASGAIQEPLVPTLAREGCAVFIGMSYGRDYIFINGEPVKRTLTFVNGVPTFT